MNKLIMFLAIGILLIGGVIGVGLELTKSISIDKASSNKVTQYGIDNIKQDKLLCDSNFCTTILNKDGVFNNREIKISNVCYTTSISVITSCTNETSILQNRIDAILDENGTIIQNATEEITQTNEICSDTNISIQIPRKCNTVESKANIDIAIEGEIQNAINYFDRVNNVTSEAKETVEEAKTIEVIEK